MPSSDQAEIRPAHVDDLAEIVELIKPFVQKRLLLSRSEHEIRQLLDCGFVATQQSELVGFSAIEIYSPKLAEILCLAVKPKCQGTGLGRLLVERCVGLAQERGVMEVMAISNSESFLQSCGFDFTLPDQKKALFLQLRPRHGTDAQD